MIHIKYLCAISIIVITFWTASIATQVSDNACEQGSFCTYKCHCQNSCPGIDGFCGSNSKCDYGWFGLRCQYQDLMSLAGTAIQTEDRINDTALIIDGNDETCIKSKYLRSVTVSGHQAYASLNWLRVVINETANLWTLKVSYIKEKDFILKDCTNTTIYQTGSQTIDLRCNDDVIITSFTLSGNLTSLCSLYVSGGRNIAFRQNATLSPGLSESANIYVAKRAVDGNKTTNVLTCRSQFDATPQLNVALQSYYIAHRFSVFMTVDRKKMGRLKGFLLQTFNDLNLAMEYKASENNAQVVYYINSITTHPINKISISTLNSCLTICELEAYGECPAGKWGLPCTQNCPSSCPLTCHIDDGLCSSVCFGFVDPPYCTQVCTKGRWGINCRENCSKCVSNSCHNQNGLCDQGCLGYSDPPFCNLACSEGTWGVNCSQSCSSQCKTTNCNSVDGTCDGGCKDGYPRSDCTQDYYGADCNEKCSKYCVGGKCENVFGNCVEGCQAGFKLPRCSQACDVGKYGSNCLPYCSSNCLNGTCDAVSGRCNQTGYEENICRELQKSYILTFVAGYGAGSATVMILGIIVLTIYCCRRRCVNKSLKINISQTPNNADSEDHPYSLAQIENVPMTSDYETIAKCTYNADSEGHPYTQGQVENVPMTSDYETIPKCAYNDVESI